MIQTSPTMRILVATQPVDFRRGIDGLAAICRKHQQHDPMSVTTFWTFLREFSPPWSQPKGQPGNAHSPLWSRRASDQLPGTRAGVPSE